MSHWSDLAIEIDGRGFNNINKYICSGCVEDEFLKNWIEENSIETGECDYCHRIHNIVPMEDIMDEVIMKTIRKYYENAEGNMHWDNEEYEYWGSTYDTEDVVGDFAEQISSDQQVIDDIINAIHDITWCKYDPYGMTEREVCEYSWKSFSDTVKYKNRYFFLQQHDDEDYERYSPLSILSIIAENAKKLGIIKTLPANFDFYRVRTFNSKNEVLLNGANLGAPPKELASTDRMSARGISAFYTSDKLETSLKEVKNKEPNHNIIAFGKFNNVRELKYLDLTEIKSMSLPSVFDLNQYTLREAILFLKDLNDDLTRPIEELHEIEYVPTQIFAEYFKFVEHLDGIKYSSSKDHNESCYVLFFDNEQCIDDSKKESWRQNCELKLVDAKIINEASTKNV